MHRQYSSNWAVSGVAVRIRSQLVSIADGREFEFGVFVVM